MKNKTILIVCTLIVLAGISFYYHNNSQTTPVTDNKPIKIGALLPLTGGLATYGEPAQKIAALAVEEINANGGINGRPISINFQDHQCKPPLAVSIFQQLSTANDTHIFTAVACSGTIMSVAPLLGDNNVMLGNTITAASISGVSPSVFRNYASDADTAKLFSDYIIKTGTKKVAIIYEETEYAKGLKINVERNLEGKGVTIVAEGYAPETSDIRSQVTKLKASNPDLLFISPQTVTSGDKILKYMEEIKFRPKELIVNENIFRSTDLIKNYSRILEGAISNDYRAPNTIKSRRVLKAYKEKYGEECPQVNICTGVYDNIYMLAQAVETVGENPIKVREYLKNIQYDGVGGEITFDDKNDRADAHFILYTIKDGQGVELY